MHTDKTSDNGRLYRRNPRSWSRLQFASRTTSSGMSRMLTARSKCGSVTKRVTSMRAHISSLCKINWRTVCGLAAKELTLEDYMNKEQPFLDADISVRQIADKLNIAYYNLSMTINIELNKNFNNYIKAMTDMPLNMACINRGCHNEPLFS